MKGLAIFTAVLMLVPLAATAGGLELHLSGGPARAMLAEQNAIIVRYDALIDHLNEILGLLPNVEGRVPQIGVIGTGLSLAAGERYWITQSLALGGSVSYFDATSGAQGTYLSLDTDTTSEILFHLRTRLLQGILQAELRFLDAGVVLAAAASFGYHYGLVDAQSLFEIPEEYPDALSQLPPEIDDRFTGGGWGGDVALSVSYPFLSWMGVRAEVSYRYLPLVLTDDDRQPLDLDGNGTPERVNFGGFAVRVGLSFHVDLTAPDGKE